MIVIADLDVQSGREIMILQHNHYHYVVLHPPSQTISVFNGVRKVNKIRRMGDNSIFINEFYVTRNKGSSINDIGS